MSRARSSAAWTCPRSRRSSASARSSSTAASSSSTGAAASRTSRPGWIGNTSAPTIRATPAPISASTARANVTPSVGGCSVATRAAETAACCANMTPEPSSRATLIVNPTTTASCHQPTPIAVMTRSPMAMPSVTPSASSNARRPRSPTVSPSVMIAATGAKNGCGWPTSSVATIHATVAASITCRIERATLLRSSARARADARERCAASSSSGCARSPSDRGGSSVIAARC